MSYPVGPTLGAIVGTASVTGSNQLTITLTADVPKSDNNLCRGLMIYVASSEDTASAPLSLVSGAEQTLRTPVISDSLVNKFRAPYFDRENSIQDPFQIWTNYRSSGGKSHMIRGGWNYIVYNTLLAGQTITLDYSHAPALDWLSANVHLITGVPPNDYAWQEQIVATSPETVPITINLLTGSAYNVFEGYSVLLPIPHKWWAGLCIFSVLSLHDNEDFSAVGAEYVNIPNKQYSIVRSGVFSIAYSTYNFTNQTDSSFGSMRHSNSNLILTTSVAGGYFAWLITVGLGTVYGAIPYPAPTGAISMKAIVR